MEHEQALALMSDDGTCHEDYGPMPVATMTDVGVWVAEERVGLHRVEPGASDGMPPAEVHAVYDPDTQYWRAWLCIPAGGIGVSVVYQVLGPVREFRPKRDAPLVLQKKVQDLMRMLTVPEVAPTVV